MNTQGVKRKLAAILSADVEGYSRLMGEHEVKNIEKPIRVYRVLSHPGAALYKPASI